MEAEKVKKRLSELQLTFSRQVAENKKRMDDEAAEHMRVFQQMIDGVTASLENGAENVAVEGGEGGGVAGVGGAAGEVYAKIAAVNDVVKGMPDGGEEGEMTAGADAEKDVVPRGTRVKMTLMQHKDRFREKEKAMLVQQVKDDKKADDLEDKHVAVDKSTPKQSGAGGTGVSSKGFKGVGGICKKDLVKEHTTGSEVDEASEDEVDGAQVLTVVRKFNDPDAVTGEWVCSYCPKSFSSSNQQKALITKHMDKHHGMVLENSEALKRERKKQSEAERRGRKLLEDAMRLRGEGKSVESVHSVHSVYSVHRVHSVCHVAPIFCVYDIFTHRWRV
jgi:hypothetical protein